MTDVIVSSFVFEDADALSGFETLILRAPRKDSTCQVVPGRIWERTVGRIIPPLIFCPLAISCLATQIQVATCYQEMPSARSGVIRPGPQWRGVQLLALEPKTLHSHICLGNAKQCKALIGRQNADESTSTSYPIFRPSEWRDEHWNYKES